MNKLLLFFTFLFFPVLVFAVDMDIATATATAHVEYTLPYPGMLPDSPLYFMKQIRDFLMDKVIEDPIRKADFYILQGDKRLAMGVALDAGGKAVLGEQVLSKAEKYMNNAVQLLASTKSQGKVVPADILDRLSKSLAKHKEVLISEIAKAAESGYFHPGTPPLSGKCAAF